MPGKNRHSECSAVFTEPYQKEYRELLRDWLTGGRAKACHTLSRQISQCMRFQDEELFEVMSFYRALITEVYKLEGRDINMVKAVLSLKWL